MDVLSAGCSASGADWYAAVNFLKDQVQKQAKDGAWGLIREMREWPAEKWREAGLVAETGRGMPCESGECRELRAENASPLRDTVGKSELPAVSGPAGMMCERECERVDGAACGACLKQWGENGTGAAGAGE